MDLTYPGATSCTLLTESQHETSSNSCFDQDFNPSCWHLVLGPWSGDVSYVKMSPNVLFFFWNWWTIARGLEYLKLGTLQFLVKQRVFFCWELNEDLDVLHNSCQQVWVKPCFIGVKHQEKNDRWMLASTTNTWSKLIRDAKFFNYCWWTKSKKKQLR